MSTRKVMDINPICSVHLVCILEENEDSAKYRLLRTDGNRRRQLGVFNSIIAVLQFVKEFFVYGVDVMSLPEQVEFAKRYT